jgi:peptidoglycan/xylan/chitin deacetylase (PgdA/CDA1 family)
MNTIDPPGEDVLRRQIPDGTVLLTFDDGNRSDLTVAAPILLEHGFAATFFITEGLGFLTGDDGGEYLSWDEVAELHRLGFEVGNHSQHHRILGIGADEQVAELAHIQDRCVAHGIPAPTAFCFPGFVHDRSSVEALRKVGFRFARRGVFPGQGPSPEFTDRGSGGRGPHYEPARHHPLLIPTTGYAGPDWSRRDLAEAIDGAHDGRVASLVFHGVPGRQHPWVSAEPETFAGYMRYLADRGCNVIAVRDLATYIDPASPSFGDPYDGPGAPTAS